jgi:hypothetical protein
MGVKGIVFLTVLLLFSMPLSNACAQAHIVQSEKKPFNVSIPHDRIICQGFQKAGITPRFVQKTSAERVALVTYLNTQPMVQFASLVETTITVKFIDDFSVVLFDVSPGNVQFSEAEWTPFSTPLTCEAGSTNTAVLLNPFEYVYGHHQCQGIISSLLRHDYSISYLANQAVNISYLRHNLSADIIYMDTHAGYFDVNNDQQADSVVIATGEQWTNETTQKYAFEYQHKMIVEGMVGDTGFVAFTPAFIEYYYAPGTLSGALVYMATCYASYDASMAEVFLNAGASVYMGWSRNTVFWTNSKTSVTAFHLLTNGLTVQQVCRIIRTGGLYNRLFFSRLVWYGDGTYKIPR